MVKPPIYRAMDDARQEMIPRAIENACKEHPELELVTIPPVDTKVPGGIPRPSFKITRKHPSRNITVATFSPHKVYKCHDPSFKEEFDEIVRIVEKAADQALEDYLEEHPDQRDPREGRRAMLDALQSFRDVMKNNGD